jgi:hypothetical protein
MAPNAFALLLRIRLGAQHHLDEASSFEEKPRTPTRGFTLSGLAPHRLI